MKDKRSFAPDRAELDLVFTLFNEIGIISQLSGTQFERLLPDGLSRSQFTILNWFCRVDDQATPGRLARALELTRGAITNSIKKLEAKQLITITPDKSSGRQKIVRLTKKGRQLRDRSILSAHPLMMQVLQDVGVKKLTTLLPALQEIREYLDARRSL
jgi:DNA-binding MarR family transcriptional regulator|tara:strand:- start:5847 stop:6320 length:474 start_codon:yes stop_codon:yes gene_type:complete